MAGNPMKAPRVVGGNNMSVPYLGNAHGPRGMDLRHGMNGHRPPFIQHPQHAPRPYMTQQHQQPTGASPLRPPTQPMNDFYGDPPPPPVSTNNQQQQQQQQQQLQQVPSTHSQSQHHQPVAPQQQPQVNPTQTAVSPGVSF